MLSVASLDRLIRAVEEWEQRRGAGMTDRTSGKPDLLTAAMLRWFDELAAQGIFTTDTGLVVRSWNRWLEQHTGLARADVVGRPLFEVCPDLVTRGFERTTAPR